MVDNRWQDAEAAACTTLLAQRVYSTQLLGRDPALVMHGGGNTSLKTTVRTLLGDEEPVLHIKGSGWDLATIKPEGLPAVRLEPLLRLQRLPALDDATMVNQLRTQLLEARAPDPSVETLLHAFLPHRFIDHTHADAVLTLTNQADGEQRVRALYGETVGIVPYVMPGFALALACAAIYQARPEVTGLILLRHGVFSFGATAKESYERMIAIVARAEEHIAAQRRTRPPARQALAAGAAPRPAPPSAAASASVPTPAATPPAPPARADVAWWAQALRAALAARGMPGVCLIDASPAAVAFASHPQAGSRGCRGPLTPDHVIRTKRLPLVVPPAVMAARAPAELGSLIDRYAEDYRAYFARGQARVGTALRMLDPLPRVVVLPGVGLAALGSTVKDARIVQDIVRHTVAVIEDSDAIGSYEGLPEEDLFAMEYWSLEQAKLALGPKRLPLTGRTAVISGGASGIGLAIVREFLAQGASVAILDINRAAGERLRPELTAACTAGNTCEVHAVDVTDRAQVAGALEATVAATGGIDITVVNAGIFPPSAPLEDIPLSQWDQTMAINCTGAFHLLAESLRWMRGNHGGGDIVLIASKNVPAPGKQAGAYSASKAAQTQLARVAALEGAAHGIRVNTLHPHLVLDTGIWNDEVIAARAAAYGMSVAAYRTNNLLRTEIGAADVAKAAFALVGGWFAKTTGAQICVDGGSDRTL